MSLGKIKLQTNIYSPISILPSLSKVFETLIHLRISPDLERTYYKYMFAYRKHLGCDTTILTLTVQ